MGAYYLQSISTHPQERKKVIETMHFIMIMPHKLQQIFEKTLKMQYKDIMSRDVIVNGGNKMDVTNHLVTSSVVSDQRFTVIVFYH